MAEALRGLSGAGGRPGWGAGRGSGGVDRSAEGDVTRNDNDGGCGSEGGRLGDGDGAPCRTRQAITHQEAKSCIAWKDFISSHTETHLNFLSSALWHVHKFTRSMNAMK